MSEKMDAEDISETINALWQKLDRIIINWGGLVDKHIGDSLMALFGTSSAQEDDTERAIRAALDIQAALVGFRLQMRIGINTGPVILGAVGTTGEYTALGDTVNIASRLEQAAPLGTILISHNTFRHVRGVFEVEVLPPVDVKGKTGKVQIYLVKRAKPRAFRVSTRGVEGIETPIIGRETELIQLQQIWHIGQEQGKLQLVAISAEAGMGKSRLLYEFGNWLELLPLNFWILRGRVTQESLHQPYALIRSCLAFRFHIQESDSAEAAYHKLERGIMELMQDDPDAQAKAHFIGYLIGFSFVSSPFLAGILHDVKQIHDRALYYIAQLFQALAQIHPVVLYLEDLHWADDKSLDLLEYLVPLCQDLRMLIIATTRPVLFERRTTLPFMAQIELPPLSKLASQKLLREILCQLPQIPETLLELLVERADGNPFYLEELVKILIDDEVILKNEEEWQLDMAKFAEVRVPPTLTGLLQARLDSLSEQERQVLQKASVVGRIFWEELLQQLQTATLANAKINPPTTPKPLLQMLQQKELVFQRHDSSFAGTAEYIFKHALLHEVTYESVLKRERRLFHAQVAEWLVKRSGERVGEFAGIIAQHYERAELPIQAMEWYGKAGKQAQETYAPQAAITYYQKALALLPHNGVENNLQQVDWMEGLGDVLAVQVRYEEAYAAYQDVLQITEANVELIRQVRVWYKLAKAQQEYGIFSTSLQSIERALLLGRNLLLTREVAEILAACLTQKGWIYFRLGEPQDLSLTHEALNLCRQFDLPNQMADAMRLLMAFHWRAGEFDQAWNYGEQCLTIYRQIGNLQGEGRIFNNIALIFYARGDYATALSYMGQASQIQQEAGDRSGQVTSLSNMARLNVELKEFRKSETYAKQVLELSGSTGFGDLGRTLSILCEACLGQGRVTEALSYLRQLLPLVLAEQDPQIVGMVWKTVGLVGAALIATQVDLNSIDWRIDEEYLPPKLLNPRLCFRESECILAEKEMFSELAVSLHDWIHYEISQHNQARAFELYQQIRLIDIKLGADFALINLEAEALSLGFAF